MNMLIAGFVIGFIVGCLSLTIYYSIIISDGVDPDTEARYSSQAWDVPDKYDDEWN